MKELVLVESEAANFQTELLQSFLTLFTSPANVLNGLIGTPSMKMLAPYQCQTTQGRRRQLSKSKFCSHGAGLNTRLFLDPFHHPLQSCTSWAVGEVVKKALTIITCHADPGI